MAALATVGLAAATPPVPTGWSQVFLDDFDGAAGSGVNPANWQYTTGTSYPGGPGGFGTGEVETMTADPANVSLDGAGNLRITPRRDAAGNWTSGRIETRRADFRPPAGGTLRTEARIQMPNVTGPAAKGYWPAFWMRGARRVRPGAATTPPTTPPTGNRDAYAAVQAESHDDQSGTVKEATTDTGGWQSRRTVPANHLNWFDFGH